MLWCAWWMSRNDWGYAFGTSDLKGPNDQISAGLLAFLHGFKMVKTCILGGKWSYNRRPTQPAETYENPPNKELQ